MAERKDLKRLNVTLLCKCVNSECTEEKKSLNPLH